MNECPIRFKDNSPLSDLKQINVGDKTVWLFNTVESGIRVYVAVWEKGNDIMVDLATTPTIYTNLSHLTKYL